MGKTRNKPTVNNGYENDKDGGEGGGEHQTLFFEQQLCDSKRQLALAWLESTLELPIGMKISKGFALPTLLR